MKVITILERMRPKAMVMALPSTGKKEKKPIHEPWPAMKRCGTIDHQYPGIEPRGHQSQHHGFAGEGEEAASQESCQEHSPIAVLGEKTYYEIHRFMLVRNKVTAASTKKRIFVRRELVRAMKWPMIGLTEIIMMWKVR